MIQKFRLIKEEFSDEFQERQWTYELKIIFNIREINQITITDHPWKKKGREKITKELILELLEKMSGQTLKSIKYQGRRKPYKWETTYQGQRYRLIFWFEDDNPNHLWIRNCYPID